MAHGGDMSDFHGGDMSDWEYEEATNSAISKFRDISISEPEESWVGDTRVEDEKEVADEEVEDEANEEVEDEADRVELQLPRIDGRNTDTMRPGLTWEQMVVKDDSLTLTGPDRALAVTDGMFFELHLKVKNDGEGDQVFCKGLLEHNTARHTRQFMALTLESWLSTVQLAFTIVPYAVEASVAASILKGPSNFIGKIVAWTTRNDKNEIILYDSQVAGPHMKHGTLDIELTRYIVAVPLDEDLVVNVSLCGSDCEAECLEFIIGNDFEKCTSTRGAYQLQVNVVWRGVMRQRRPNMWEYFGDYRVLR
ncbi:hypothetical protein HU200_004211 [Digitaria exilis]|uniref:DUF6598 domain-containing protein n=1 Tax=Digitaria exilis TaxID=1010633 RepID=A0A835KU05_9POAL|nr:hypothetical protein HU200_004211 [Digitaria exilis]